MEIILRADVQHLGKIGEIVKPLTMTTADAETV